jgi:hypothetical protein
MGESRPSWWVWSWSDHIVVLKGTLRFALHDPPDIEVKISPDTLLAQFPDEKERELTKRLSKYYVATVTVDELLFASPGIEETNTRISAMRAGKVRSVKALVMALESPDHPPFFFNVRPDIDNNGVFIFRYGTMVPSIPMVFAEPIPEEGLQSAMAVFDYRDRYDYHTRPAGHQPFRPENEEGVVGLGFSPKSFPIIENVMTNSPASKAGIRAGDCILAVNQQPTFAMSLDEFLKQAAGPPGSIVELTIRHSDNANSQSFKLQHVLPPDRG